MGAPATLGTAGTFAANASGASGSGEGITLSSNKDVTLTAIAVNGGTGNVVVQATGNLTLGANADAVQTNQTHFGGGSSFWTTTNTTTHYQTQDVNAAVTSLQGNDITLKAGDTLTNYAAVLSASPLNSLRQISTPFFARHSTFFWRNLAGLYFFTDFLPAF